MAMRMVDIIHKKRNGFELTKEEINFFVEGYTTGDIPDYQASALLMAIFFKGMNPTETAGLTEAMVYSGETIDLSKIAGHKVDKHSTGGVGDKTSFIVGPLVASLGIPVAKMSGRGLGHTGGTIDKLESIEGFDVEMDKEAFIRLVNLNKLAIAGQTGNLAPADKKLYALRDVTATVDSIPLIAGSIMSKKLASGADSIVLDVKTGSGAFMKSLEDSEMLAKEMVNIGNRLGKNTVAIISDMNQPLGYEVGNAREIREAVHVLKGEKVADLRELSLVLASHMVVLAGKYANPEEAIKALEENLDNGKAYQVFRKFIIAQNGTAEMIDDVNKLPSAKISMDISADVDGYVSEIDAEKVGLAAMYLGAGRAKKDDHIHHGVGITIRKKLGDKVSKGQALVTIHAETENPIKAISTIKEAYRISNIRPKRAPLIHKVIF